MATTIKQPTLSQVRAAARRRWGKSAWVGRFNDLTQSQRQLLLSRKDELAAKLENDSEDFEELKNCLDALGLLVQAGKALLASGGSPETAMEFREALHSAATEHDRLVTRSNDQWELLHLQHRISFLAGSNGRLRAQWATLDRLLDLISGSP